MPLSQHVLYLCTAYKFAETQQVKAARSKELKEALMELINQQLQPAAEQSNCSTKLLKRELMKSLDNNVLKLCSEMSTQVSPCDVVNRYLADIVTIVKDSQAYERDIENQRLAELLKAYRASHASEQEAKAEAEAKVKAKDSVEAKEKAEKAKAETTAKANALYRVLGPLMKRMATPIVLNKGLPPEYVDKVIEQIVMKWLKHEDEGGILYDWCEDGDWGEDGGRSISSWIWGAIGYAVLDHWRKFTAEKMQLAPYHNGDEEEADPTNNVQAPYTGSQGWNHVSKARHQEILLKLQRLILEIPGKKAVRHNVILTENHAMIVQNFLDNPDLTADERALRLGHNYKDFKRWLVEVTAYGENHPDRCEWLELLAPRSPVGKRYKNLLQQQILDIPGKNAVLYKDVTLTENHAMIVQSFLENPGITGEERAKRLGQNYPNFKRYLCQLYAYGKDHPDRDEWLGLLIARSPVGSDRSSILKADSYKSWDWNTKVALQQLIQGIPNRKVVLDNRNVTLNEGHAMIVQSFLDNPELSVEERAEHLGYNCDNFNRYLRELYAYGKNHHVSAVYRRNGFDLTKYVQGGHQK